LQLPNFRDRESNNEEVLKDVDCPIDPSYRIKVDAFSILQGLIPDVRYRMTLKYRYNSECERTDEAKYHHRPALYSKGSCRKDLEVEGENRDFNEAECYNVEDFAKID
jgi:hypothetical protein